MFTTEPNDRTLTVSNFEFGIKEIFRAAYKELDWSDVHLECDTMTAQILETIESMKTPEGTSKKKRELSSAIKSILLHGVSIMRKDQKSVTELASEGAKRIWQIFDMEEKKWAEQLEFEKRSVFARYLLAVAVSCLGAPFDPETNSTRFPVLYAAAIVMGIFDGKASKTKTQAEFFAEVERLCPGATAFTSYVEDPSAVKQ